MARYLVLFVADPADDGHADALRDVARRVPGAGFFDDPMGGKQRTVGTYLRLDEAELRLPYEPRLATLGDVVHGGAIAALLDTAGMAAAWSDDALVERAAGATVSINVAYAAAAVAIAAEDIRVTMPPAPMVFEGLVGLAPLLARALGPDRDGDWRLLATSANRLPAAASYLRRPGDTRFRAFKLDVIRVADGRIAEITTFSADLFPAFGLQPTL